MVHSDMIVGDYVQIDDEVFRVTGIDDNTLTVNRCQLGTNAATHSERG